MKDVSSLLTKELIEEKATILFNTIRRDFNISNPRVAILALNPTEQGNEEKEIIAPAISNLAEKGRSSLRPLHRRDLL